MKKLSCLIVVSMSIHLFTGIFISSCLAAGISPIEKAFSQTSIEDVHVSLNVQQVTIEAAFQSIADQTEFKFVYGGKAQPFVSTQEISLNVENKSVADVLRIIARETGANFMQSDLNIIVQAPPPGLIKGKIPEREEKEFLDRTIKGKITDENG
ncbi:MAG: hypothetical protein MI921_11990, partial [Cytophagales bacterium]|nr:hypothetical protein [Cytophagales bacterium]